MQPRVRIVPDRCLGNGNCVRVAPAYFDQEQEDGRVELLRTDIDAGDFDTVQAAVAQCPVHALRIDLV